MVEWRSDAAHPRHSLSAPGSRALTTRARDPVPPVGSSQPSTPKATYPAVPDHSNHHIDRDWQHRASCLGTDTERFFSPDGERGNVRAQREHAAKPICQDCPVLAECRTHALAATEAYGIWGGMSETSAPARPDVPASRPGPGSSSRHRTLEPRRTRARHEVEQSRPPTYDAPRVIESGEYAGTLLEQVAASREEAQSPLVHVEDMRDSEQSGKSPAPVAFCSTAHFVNVRPGRGARMSRPH